MQPSAVKLAFHDADTDFLARILAGSPDTPVHAKILARMSVSWNASFTTITVTDAYSAGNELTEYAC